MAALLSQETSLISGLNFLDRGYENLVAKLTALGADVERLSSDQAKKEEKQSTLLFPVSA
jgi:UDP-N-acetylglucosamine 1-carboxyvinyltransferase